MKRISGHGRGKGLGAPTLNLNFQSDLPFGVYAVWISADGLRLPAVANWGPRPTFHETDAVFEAHLLVDFPEEWDLVEDFEVESAGFLREIRKFADANELSQQIRQDIEKARLILA